MIIDSVKYSGECKCGHCHEMETEFCVIERGSLKNFEQYVSEYHMSGYSVAIYDTNTYAAAESVRPKADKEIILPPENLHADNRGVALAMEQLPEKCGYLIAVGSGTIHDITRYCAYEKGIPFISCPTAASVDGFCSSMAAMTWDGFKKTFTATAPKIVVADLDIISKAPIRLTNSGFGDMIGKFVALAEWKISHTLTEEYFCPVIYDMTLEATKAVIDSAEAIKKGDINAYEKLVYGLLMSGIAMQLLGNSRCASGAEHHISHFIEMHPKALGTESEALHGEKVGVGTLLVSKEYHRIKTMKVNQNKHRQSLEQEIKDIFGDELSDSIIKENAVLCTDGVTNEMICSNWKKICDIIDEIPTYEELIKKYNILGAKSQLSDIDIPENKLDMILEYSPLVRNRLTLMRLRRNMEI